MSSTYCPVDDSLLVRCACRVLATDGAKVVLQRVGGVAQRLPGAAFDDAGVPHHQGSRSLSGYAEIWVREFIYLIQHSIMHDF
jgi:hypothetical protein